MIKFVSKMSLLLLVAVMLFAAQSRAMPAPAEDGEIPEDVLPDPAGDVDVGGNDNDSIEGDAAGESVEGEADEPDSPELAMTPENLADLKDIWSDPDIPEVEFKRPRSKLSPKTDLRNTMGGGGFRRPRVRFGDYYIQG